jgi:23S rRNA (adenine2503-C2)-methyltransferase
MIGLLSMDMPQLENIVEELGEKKFAAKQLRSWLCKGVPFEEMTNLSKTLREKLKERYCEGYARIAKKLTSKDGTVKYLLEMMDGNLIECVVMDYHHGRTLCVSTQVGCRMGCVFCASGMDGLVRQLSAGEMLSELIAARESGEISNVVLMGSGEPLDNYDNVTAFLRAMQSEFGIGQRHMSLSTCGLVPAMMKLAEEKLSVTLCISLHAAIDEKRKQLMPIAKAYSISDIMDAAKAYFKKTGRRIIIEYTLIRGFNDGQEDIDALKRVLGGLNCHINVIPINHAAGDFSSPSKTESFAFAAALERSGQSATVRRALGSDIEGACGQLKRRAGEL